MNEQVPRARFRSMDEGTAEDWAVIGSHFFPYAKGLPDRVLDHLRLLDGDYGGFPIDRLQHSPADRDPRASRRGRRGICGHGPAPRHRRHARHATTIPTSPRRSSSPSSTRSCTGWCEHHGIFQGYYFFHYLGMDRDMREQFRGHPAFRGYRPLLRALRPDRVRPIVRNRAARFLRADGPPRFRGTEAVHLR